MDYYYWLQNFLNCWTTENLAIASIYVVVHQLNLFFVQHSVRTLITFT